MESYSVEFESRLGFGLGLIWAQCLFGADIRKDNLHDGAKEAVNREQVGENEVFDSLGWDLAVEDRDTRSEAYFAVFEIEFEAAVAETEIDAIEKFRAGYAPVRGNDSREYREKEYVFSVTADHGHALPLAALAGYAGVDDGLAGVQAVGPVLVLDKLNYGFECTVHAAVWFGCHTGDGNAASVPWRLASCRTARKTL